MHWESPSDIAQKFTSRYWNDIEIEKTKEWWIENDEDIDKLQNYLYKSGLMEEFELCLAYFSAELSGRILDVAAGVAWTSALLSRRPTVRSVDALEFSYHRISNLADLVIKGLSGDEAKIRKIYGSFYNIKSEGTYDAIFMSQAFHHAEKALHLLVECDRCLAPGGSIVLMGEHLINFKMYTKAIFRRFVKNIVRNKKFKLETKFSQLFPIDPVLGDHYYLLRDYYFMFKQLGYSVT
ncbi:MAG: class I SAM-dependent methyltransferase, partial [Proteobacteria bacterium]|nr:class I SAM-dependent methyltransferase [Pseudomonadota bacterium]